ncbi:putative toxin-antitoxin system toxin component, PIN family [Candidatus Shapirobacteria bacterium]|nr:putative toxin-antitoxin system toxin component, PIN family [Candidatus Shapirobacteria bacterium]
MSLSIKPRVVLDTNVLVSGILWGGKPGLVIKHFRQNKFVLLVSPFVLAELTNFLEEHRIERRQRQIILDEFETRPIKIIPPEQVNLCRDAKDNQVLDLCSFGEADYLVTGDKDLLALKKFGKTKIITPKEFLLW